MSSIFQGATINTDHTLRDWGCAITNSDIISVPEPNLTVLEIPGRNGRLDLSEALTGDITYGNRTIKLELAVSVNISTWFNKCDYIFRNFHGKIVTVTFTINTDAHAVSYKKAAKKKVTGLSRNAVKAILEAPNANTLYGLRDVTLLTLLYGSAARIDELLSMKISDLHLNVVKPYAIITGKREVTRTLYLLPRAVEYLSLYMKVFHGEHPANDDYLFFSPIQGKGKKLSQQAVFKMLRKYAEIAHNNCEDVPLDLHAHQFRHAKASHWLEDGMNIVQISFLLGHASIETTMVYLDITTDKEYEALATLEGERQRNVKPKWDKEKDTLSAICGLRKLNK